MSFSKEVSGGISRYTVGPNSPVQIDIDGQVMADTAVLEEKSEGSLVVGFKERYMRLLPEGMGVSCVLLGSEELTKADRGVIAQAIDEHDVILLQGGEDPGPALGATIYSNEPNRRPSTKRDVVDHEIIQRVRADHSKFVLGVCRGMESFFPKELAEADEQNYPMPGNGSETVNKLIRLAGGAEAIADGLPVEFKIPSAHHLHVRKLPDRAQDEGWRVLYEDPYTKSPEIVVRLDTNGHITGILFQGHPERFEEGSEVGNRVLAWVRECILQHVNKILSLSSHSGLSRV